MTDAPEPDDDDVYDEVARLSMPLPVRAFSLLVEALEETYGAGLRLRSSQDQRWLHVIREKGRPST